MNRAKSQENIKNFEKRAPRGPRELDQINLQSVEEPVAGELGTLLNF